MTSQHSYASAVFSTSSFIPICTSLLPRSTCLRPTMDLRLLLDDSPAPEVTGRLRGHTSSLPASQSAPSLFPPTPNPQSYTQQQHSHRTNQPELSPREGGLAAAAGAVRGSYLGQGAGGELRWAGPPPPPPAGPALPSISSFFDLRIPPTPARHPYGSSSSRAYASERTQVSLLLRPRSQSEPSGICCLAQADPPVQSSC